ncbi:microtubule-associated protein futsch [Rhagoletis pomonella]|uniref:microtubule-associated protein futsch n=1 Tax=Rhagoletis pomonella TaxID=28610 RepID=UPI00177B629B|nr:microtubule-associated protein futsch [Rhagoletis pomonella]
MSFFRNFRAKARSKSSSRDTTPVNTTTSSRPGSVASNVTTHTARSTTSARRESIDSRTDSLLNRSDTFILNSDEEEEDKQSKHNSSNSSTLEKKSKKSKVLSKFATFTKRKKTPTPEKIVDPLEHHPSDNATNTYYKWKADGPTSSHTLDYDSQSDPFNFLYEQHSSLKGMHQGSSNGNDSVHSSHSSNSNTQNQPFDSSTYRKGKIPTQLKEQLSQLKTQTKADLHEDEELAAEQESSADKYKTVTLNSFRKSFREKFLQNQQNPAHNPAWFVEVEPPKVETHARWESKENRPDFLVFANENYRPNSRSPVRDNKERTSRAISRPPVKRNETFRMERPTLETVKASTERHKGGTQLPEATAGSIRIEIKNSISPNMPPRVVPVGVAKPMPSRHNAQDNYQSATARSTASITASLTQANKPSKLSARDKSPLHNWGKPITVTPVRYSSAVKASAPTTAGGRYQTLVQICNEANVKPALNQQAQRSPLQRSRLSTRIQLGGGGVAGGSPILQKRLNTPGTRHSLATPLQMNALSSYELLKQTPAMTSRSTTDQQPALRKLQQPKHTYFGDATLHPANGNANVNKMISTTTFSMGRTPVHSTIGGAGGSASGYSTSMSRLPQPQVLRVAGGSANYQNRSQQQQQQQQQQQKTQQRVLVSTQRRSRSPIKIPWR